MRYKRIAKHKKLCNVVLCGKMECAQERTTKKKWGHKNNKQSYIIQITETHRILFLMNEMLLK